MAKKTKKADKKTFIRSILAGLGIIYISSAFILLYDYLIVPTVYGDVLTKMTRVTDMKQVSMQLVRDSISYSSTFGLITGIAASLLLVVFAYSGWVVLKKAKQAPWYLPAIPVLTIALFQYTPLSHGILGIFGIPFNLLFSYPFKELFILLCLFAALLGGWLQRHVSIHK
jgi:hypothetical protein